MTYLCTGKIRYRSFAPRFGKPLIVLQVEISFSDGPNDHNGLPQYLGGVRWKDAEVHDLCNIPSVTAAMKEKVK